MRGALNQPTATDSVRFASTGSALPVYEQNFPRFTALKRKELADVAKLGAKANWRFGLLNGAAHKRAAMVEVSRQADRQAETLPLIDRMRWVRERELEVAEASRIRIPRSQQAKYGYLKLDSLGRVRGYGEPDVEHAQLQSEIAFYAMDYRNQLGYLLFRQPELRSPACTADQQQRIHTLLDARGLPSCYATDTSRPSVPQKLSAEAASLQTMSAPLYQATIVPTGDTASSCRGFEATRDFIMAERRVLAQRAPRVQDPMNRDLAQAFALVEQANQQRLETHLTDTLARVFATLRDGRSVYTSQFSCRPGDDYLNFPQPHSLRVTRSGHMYEVYPNPLQTMGGFALPPMPGETQHVIMEGYMIGYNHPEAVQHRAKQAHPGGAVSKPEPIDVTYRTSATEAFRPLPMEGLELPVGAQLRFAPQNPANLSPQQVFPYLEPGRIVPGNQDLILTLQPFEHA
ncbi:MAG: hypothetical protein KC476_05260 [Cyanobacteria bacterium HKST-UBA06]|nr:hypothetical protein [Cyanobacteria bacterium HKST-UBA06]